MYNYNKKTTCVSTIDLLINSFINKFTFYLIRSHTLEAMDEPQRRLFQGSSRLLWLALVP